VQQFLSTDRSLVALFQRVVLGVVIAGHGAQKLLGWFGGGGWDGTQAYFASQGIPAPLGALIILAESFGAIALVAGLATRLNAAGIAAIMAGTVFFEHGKNGFFMDWFGTMRGEGYEYALLAMALAIPLVVTGGGRWSLDRFITTTLIPVARS
jgi:putative oxidoreductase